MLGWVAGVACGLLAATSLGFGLTSLPPGWDCWRPVSQGSKPVLEEAIAAGQESGMRLYPCRGAINSDVLIGRVRLDFGGCHVGYGGREVEVTPYEILAMPWKPGADSVPPDAMSIGAEIAANPEQHFQLEKLYSCRAAYAAGVHAGQATAGEKGCSFGYGGKQIVEQTYDVLQSAPWLTWTGAVARNLPEDTVVSGREGDEAVSVCRASDRNGLHPGKIKAISLGCSIVSDGREAIVDRFEVLVPKWTVANAGTLPLSSYPAGWEGRSSQFVCRAQDRNTMQIGRVSESLGGCHVGMKSGETVFQDYEVLTQ